MDFPVVPEASVRCEFCECSISAGQGILPVSCPHCGKQLRPKTNSVWSHFVFGLFRRGFVWKGRATRKEYWSVVIPITFAFFLFVPVVGVASSLFQPGDSLLIQLVVFLCILILSFLFINVLFMFATARRLHDISISGKWSALYTFLSCALYVIYTVSAVYSFADYLSVMKELECMYELQNVVSDEYQIGECDSTFLYPSSENSPGLSSELLIEHHPIFKFCSLFDTLLGLILFGLCFIDSKKGSNKYGLSRKYLLD